jgi:hypothetical protein
MTLSLDYIRKKVGWCPNSYVRAYNTEVRLDGETVVPSSGGSFKDSAIHWLGLFRNQMMLQAIGSFCAGFYMFAGLGGVSGLTMFIIGLVAGLAFSAIVGIWYWRIFNEVLHEGPVVLWNRYDTTSGTLTVVSVAVSIIVPVLALTGAIPGVNLAMTTAFFGGLVAVLFWGVLIAIWKWETDSHRQLHYDGMILKLEKEDHGMNIRR